MALPYVGSRISLITNSELRYEGILDAVNTQNSTVTLRDVRMFGTESRKVPVPVQPTNQLFEYIVFNGKDIKDLTVCDMPPVAHSAALAANDPAIVNLSPHTAGGNAQYNNSMAARQMGANGGAQMMMQTAASGMNDGGYNVRANNSSYQQQNGMMPMYGNQSNPVRNYSQQQQHYNANNGNNMRMMAGNMKQQQSQQHGQQSHQSQQQQQQGRYSYNNVSTANNASGNNRGNNNTSAYGKQSGRNNGQQQQSSNGNANGSSRATGVIVGELPADVNTNLKNQVAEAFDFESSNKNFNKSQVVEEAPQTENLATTSYDKRASFFDNISCETLDKQQGRTGRTDRDKQRELDVETFGQSATMARGPRYYRRGFRRGRPQQRNGGRGPNNGGAVYSQGPSGGGGGQSSSSQQVWSMIPPQQQPVQHPVLA